MKYIKRYRIFESESLEQLPTFNNKELDDMMQDLKYILLDLHDEGWVVNLSYDPKRSELTRMFGGMMDTITVTIQKKSPSTRYSPTYPLDSEFVLADVSEYTLRILEYFDNLKHEIKTCRNSDTTTNTEFLSAGNLGYIHGGWYTMHNVDLESKEKVLAVNIKIFLEKEDWDLDESTF